jgi:ArsR family transcriptional regulator, arsenate/arsenite/antimonite-responsive transcriptional repressor
MRDLTSLGQALVDPTRVRILAALRHGELCVCELVDAMEVSQSTLSGHLQVLRQTNLVQTRKESRWIYYCLSPRFADLIEAIFGCLEPNSPSDPRLCRDAKRIARRLILRENGRCVLGFRALNTLETAPN